MQKPTGRRSLLNLPSVLINLAAFMLLWSIGASTINAQSIHPDLVQSIERLDQVQKPADKKVLIDSIDQVFYAKGSEVEKAFIDIERAKWYFKNRQFNEAKRLYLSLYQFQTEGKDSIFVQKMGNAFVQLSHLYNMIQRPDSAVWSLRKSLFLSKSIDDQFGVAVTYSNMAGMFKALGQSDSTLFYLHKGLVVVRDLNDSLGIANYLVGLGLTYTNLGNYEKAITYYLEAYDISVALEDERLMDLTLSNLSGYYMEIEDLDRAWYYVKKHLVLTDSADLSYNQGASANSAGSYYTLKGKSDSALYYLDIAIARFNQAGYIPGKLRAMTHKADLLFETQRSSEALILFQEVLETSSGLYPSLSARCLHGIARIYANQNREREAIVLMDSALSLANFEKVDIDQLNQMYHSLYEMYKAIGDESAALNYLERVVQTKDSLLTEENQREIARLEYNADLEKEQAVFDLRQRNQALEYEAKIDESKSIRNIILIFGIFSVLLLIVIIISYRRARKTNTLLSQQAVELQENNKKLAALHAKEQALLQDNIDEKERRMVAITMTQHEKHGVLQKIDERLQVLTKKSDEVDFAELRGIRNMIKANLDMDSSWDSFVHQFDQVNPNFFAQLRERYPDITTNDLKTCAYIKVGMDNKGIAQVTNSSPNTIKSRIHRLKKKMNLEPEDNIREILIGIE